MTITARTQLRQEQAQPLVQSLHHCRFATREQAKREITEYIEI